MSASALGSVFDYLDELRQRAAMYVGEERPLRDLEKLLYGYEACLRQHGIVEAVPSMCRPFGAWLRVRNPDWSLSCGWAHAVEEHCDAHGYAMLDDLFVLIEEYRKLIPTVVLEAALQPHHEPTGRRVTIGLDQRMTRPERVQVVQYRPAPIHLLRFFYADHVEESVLRGANAAEATTIDDAKAWLADELDMGPSDWSPGTAGEQGAAG